MRCDAYVDVVVRGVLVAAEDEEIAEESRLDNGPITLVVLDNVVGSLAWVELGWLAGELDAQNTAGAILGRGGGGSAVDVVLKAETLAGVEDTDGSVGLEMELVAAKTFDEMVKLTLRLYSA